MVNRLREGGGKGQPDESNEATKKEEKGNGMEQKMTCLCALVS